MSDTGNGGVGASGSGGTPGHRKPGRWLKIVLGLSLALNLLVIGWSGARWAVHGGDRGHRHWNPAVEQAWERHGPAAHEIRESAADALGEAADALEAEPFDAAHFEASIAVLEADGAELIALGGVAAREIAAGLDAVARSRMARRLRRIARRGGSRWWRRW